jgi:ubiquinone/menaquinone biosynthesis C-methylase UbiE
MPAKHAEDLRQTYADVAAGYANHNANNVDERMLSKFVRTLPQHSRVVDLGAGTGRDSRWLVAHGMNVTMFDLSSDMLVLAHQNVPEAALIQGDMTEMVFPDSSFEGVWASASLLHLTREEAKLVVHKIYKMLTSGGVFYCLLKKGRGEEEVIEDKYGKPMKRFFTFYTREKVKRLLEDGGFQAVTVAESKSASGQEWVDALGYKV